MFCGLRYGGWTAALVLARYSLPIDKVNQFPGILIQIPLQLTLLIEDKLSRRIKYTRTLALVLVVDLNDARCEVEGLRLGIKECFPESDLAVCDEDNFCAPSPSESS